MYLKQSGPIACAGDPICAYLGAMFGVLANLVGVVYGCT